MIAVTVRYARPFASGVRLRLGEDSLAVLTPEQRRKHDHFCAIRDKYVAHSVNAFEESQPVARYWVERVQNEGITSVECNHRRVVGLSAQELNDIIDLTTVLLEYVDARLKEEKAKVLDTVRRMPLDKVLAGKPQPTSPDLSNPSKRRR